MANDVTSGGSKFNYEWNPFQDIVANNIKQELIHCDGPTKPVIIPRCFPFFPTDLVITLKGSTTPLSFQAGDYSFVYPYMTFIEGYQKLCYGGILLHTVKNASDYYVDYGTIGSKYVLDDVNYAQFVANVVNNPRTINLDQIVNFPTEFPADPHDHPAKDTMGYLDMMIWMKSYLDAITGMDTSLTIAKQFADHLKQSIQKAHGGTLADLSIKNLQDLPIADNTTVNGESNQVIGTIWAIKKLIRDFDSGLWS